MEFDIKPGNHFLDVPIDELAVSDEFKRLSKKLGFTSLRQTTDLGWGKLLQMKNFDYGWFNELVRLLKSEGLLTMLETRSA